MTANPNPGLSILDDDERQADPRGVRVSLAAGSAALDLAAVTYVVVDGQAESAALVMLDDERAILVQGSGPVARQPVILLPPAEASGNVRGVQRWEVVVDGWRVEVDVEPAARAALRERARRGRQELGESGPTEVRAIIPGVVVAVSVTAGDAVSAGQQLLVVEAMKMQNELRAPRDGTIERVAVSVGGTIDVGDLLLVLA